MIRIPAISFIQRRAFGLSMLLSSLVLATTFAVPLQAQKRSGEETPMFREYRGVQIGMTAEEARKKLGGPKEKGDEQDFYMFGDNETAQVVYDKDRKIITISVDFTNGASTTPPATAVFGADIPAKADGSVYKMVRYEKQGFWVSYSRTAGSTPMTSVTIQKIQ